MLIPANIFREYDIRGIADRELTNELVRAVGEGYAHMLAEGRPESAPPLRIAVGRDCRLSSPRIHEAFVSGLRCAGTHVIDIGTGPTPMLYFAVHHLHADGGVMVTGSHNPPDENGLKMMKGKESFFGDSIRRLRERVALLAGNGAAPGGTLERVSVEAAYIARATAGIDLSKARLKVVVDAGNGAAGPLGMATLKAAGVKPEALFTEMDGTFPNHHPDPTVLENLQPLIGRMRDTGATVGIAWDGDGDRLGAVDVNGDIVWGDKLMILFSRDILAARPGASILGEVKCSQTLYDDIAKHGGRPILWKTGHSNIKAKMKEEGALLAGEMSGHLFFADRYLGYDDAIYATLRLLEILAKTQKTMRELLADVPRTFVTPEIRVDCSDELKFDVVAYVRDHFRRRHEVIDVDGARILFGDGAWGLVRASNTGPILVLRFEAATEQRRDELRAEVEAVVAQGRQALGG